MPTIKTTLVPLKFSTYNFKKINLSYNYKNYNIITILYKIFLNSHTNTNNLYVSIAQHLDIYTKKINDGN